MRGTVGIPDTGISYSQQLLSVPKGSTNPAQPQNWWAPSGTPGQRLPPQVNVPGPRVPQPQPTQLPMTAIASASIDRLTSPSLLQFREMLIAAKVQQMQIREDSAVASKELNRHTRIKKWLSLPLVKKLAAKKLESTEVEIGYFREKLLELNDWMAGSQVHADFETSPAAQQAFTNLVHAYERLRSSQFIWDVTAGRKSQSKTDRTTAQTIVQRAQVRFDFSPSEFVQFSGRALRLQNANGEDLLIFPGVLLLERRDGMFALIGLQEVRLAFSQISFIETDPVPRDSRIIGQTWAKANKDGSPDKRFANNYQIPICQYGSLSFTSPTGLKEEFHVSNPDSAMIFGQAFSAYQQAL